MSAEAQPEGREGMVTVYDSGNRYLGCMGIETWRSLLARQEGKAMSDQQPELALARAVRAEAALDTMQQAITRYVELDRQHQRRISTQGLVAVLAGQEGKP